MHANLPNDRAAAGAVLRQARHSASISGLGAIRRRGCAGARGERARARLSLLRSSRIRARRGGAGDDRAARRSFGPGAPGAGGGLVQRQRSAARCGPRAGGGRAGSGRAGASALARADRRRPRRLRRDRRRRRPDGAGAPAQPAAPRQSRAGRDRTTSTRFSRSSPISRSIFRRNCSHRIFARFGDDPSLRDALLERPALPAALRARIVVAAAKDLARRGVAMDVARASRARRPRGARSGDLHDRLVMPSRRAGGAYARAARRRRADAGLAAAFAAWRRTDSVRRRLWRNCPACRCRASPPSSSSRRGKASPRSPAGLA